MGLRLSGEIGRFVLGIRNCGVSLPEERDHALSDRDVENVAKRMASS